MAAHNVLFVCFDMAHLAAIGTLALCRLGLFAARDVAVRRHGGPPRRSRTQCLLRLVTLFSSRCVLFESCQCFLNPIQPLE